MANYFIQASFILLLLSDMLFNPVQVVPKSRVLKIIALFFYKGSKVNNWNGWCRDPSEFEFWTPLNVPELFLQPNPGPLWEKFYRPMYRSTLSWIAKVTILQVVLPEVGIHSWNSLGSTAYSPAHYSSQTVVAYNSFFILQMVIIGGGASYI